MKRTIIYILLFFTAMSCSSETTSIDSSKHIEIGDFTLQFPNNYKLIKEKGIDSYVGKVSNGKIDFQFDYGYYSNSLEESIFEYLSEDIWSWNALGQHGLLPSGTDLSAIAKEIKLIYSKTEDSIKYTNLYQFKGDTLTYELTIPKELRETKFAIDTVENVVYKFVRKRNYVGLYAKNLGTYNKSINSHLALSIEASDLSEEETEKAFKILRSCKIQK